MLDIFLSSEAIDNWICGNLMYDPLDFNPLMKPMPIKDSGKSGHKRIYEYLEVLREHGCKNI